MPSNNPNIHWDPTEDQKSTGEGDWERLATDGPIIILHKPSCRRWLIQVVDRRNVVVAEALAYSSGSIGEVAEQFTRIAAAL